MMPGCCNMMSGFRNMMSECCDMMSQCCNMMTGFRNMMSVCRDKMLWRGGNLLILVCVLKMSHSLAHKPSPE